MRFGHWKIWSLWTGWFVYWVIAIGTVMICFERCRVRMVVSARMVKGDGSTKCIQPILSCLGIVEFKTEFTNFLVWESYNGNGNEVTVFGRVWVRRLYWYVTARSIYISRPIPLAIFIKSQMRVAFWVLFFRYRVRWGLSGGTLFNSLAAIVFEISRFKGQQITFTPFFNGWLCA